MPLHSAGNVALLLSCAFVLLGAVYFGLASCGGYTLHKQVFLGLAVVLGATALLVRNSPLRSALAKGGFAVGLFSAFFLLESAVAPFYPGPPQSFSEYLSLFIHAIEYWPCG